MTETGLTAGEQRVLTMYRQAPHYAKPIMFRAMAWLQMGVPRAKVEALWRRDLALARTKAHHGSNVINGPGGTAA